MNFLRNLIKQTFKLRDKRVYLDYASLTPVDDRVVEVTNDTVRNFPANPSSLYAEGVEAEKFLNKNREQVAKFFEAHIDEIVFTSGGTEANNLAIKGVIDGAIRNTSHAVGVSKPHVISLSIEHPSVKELLSKLESEGMCEVDYVPVDDEGLIDLKEFKSSLRKETVLVTIMYANNEIGVIQPIAEIAKTIRAFKKEHQAGNEHGQVPPYPYFHTDASQAAAYCSMRVPALGVDLMTIDGGKVYGPRGIGALYIRRGVEKTMISQNIGGGQENGMRAGTENLPAIAGLAKALEICAEERKSEGQRLLEMRDELIKEVQEIIPEATLNGHGEKRLPNNVNICFPGQDAEFLVLRLDTKGVCVSSVTSCRSKSEDSSSYVIEEINKGGDCAASSLRITLGRFTTKSDLRFFLEQLKKLNLS